MTLENCLKLFKLPLYVWHSELSALALGINKDSKRAEHNSIQCNSFCKEAVMRVFLILIPYYMILLGNFVPIHRHILQQWSQFAGRDVKVISKKQARNSFGFLDCGFCFAVSFLSAKSYNNIDFHSSDSYKLPNILYLYLALQEYIQLTKRRKMLGIVCVEFIMKQNGELQLDKPFVFCILGTSTRKV